MASRGEAQDALVSRALKDAAFRQELVDDPRAAIQRELGFQLPAGMHVKVVQETADTAYIVLPHVEGGPTLRDIDEKELEAVAGGGGDYLETQTSCPTKCARVGC